MICSLSARQRHHPVHGVSVGIMVLDTGFKRLPGDIAHADTWRFPVHYHIVKNVRPQDVIEGKAENILSVFTQAIDCLVDLGVDGIATSCGFLSILQPQLRAHSRVPIVSSSLMQIPLVQQILPANQTIGIIVSDGEAISDAHFHSIGVTPDLPLMELPPEGFIRKHMRENKLNPSYHDQEAEILDLVANMLEKTPSIGAIVCECANLAPYSHAIRARFGLPVYDIVSMIEWFHAGLRPRRFSTNVPIAG